MASTPPRGGLSGRGPRGGLSGRGPRGGSHHSSRPQGPPSHPVATVRSEALIAADGQLMGVNLVNASVGGGPSNRIVGIHSGGGERHGPMEVRSDIPGHIQPVLEQAMARSATGEYMALVAPFDEQLSARFRAIQEAGNTNVRFVRGAGAMGGALALPVEPRRNQHFTGQMVYELDTDDEDSDAEGDQAPPEGEAGPKDQVAEEPAPETVAAPEAQATRSANNLRNRKRRERARRVRMDRAAQLAETMDTGADTTVPMDTPATAGPSTGQALVPARAQANASSVPAAKQADKRGPPQPQSQWYSKSNRRGEGLASTSTEGLKRWNPSSKFDQMMEEELARAAKEKEERIRRFYDNMGIPQAYIPGKELVLTHTEKLAANAAVRGALFEAGAANAAKIAETYDLGDDDAEGVSPDGKYIWED